MNFDHEKLRELRKARCWDQHRLAEEARRFPSGITQSQISRYENGPQEPSGKNVLALAFALGIPAIDLYVRDEAEEERAADMPTGRENEFLEALRPLARLLAQEVAA